MVSLDCTLLNFSDKNLFFSIFENYGNDFEYTSNSVFRLKNPPKCSDCGVGMNHNGYNTYRKLNLGKVKIGRYICPVCCETSEEDRGFWKNMKTEFFSVLDRIYQVLRVNHVSFQGIASVMEIVFPRGKDTIMNAFNDSIEKTYIPPAEDVFIVHYDEQFPKQGRTQKYRLTLLDGVTKWPIADELYDKKDPDTIKTFLTKHLDSDKKTFVVTDLYSSYPGVLKDFFKEDKLIHQFCLLHLNKRIVNDFPKKTSIEQELVKYRLLGIFYDRDPEIQFLEDMVMEEWLIKGKGDKKEYKEWLKEKKKLFKQFLHDGKLERRRENKNLPVRHYLEALEIFNELMDEMDSFDKAVQKRLRKIEKHWENFTAFYFVENAPATNNALENHYSTSLKTHQKKALRTERGINNHMKLSQMKKAGIFNEHPKTLLETYHNFIPFL